MSDEVVWSNDDQLIFKFEKEMCEAESFMSSVRQLIEAHPEFNNFYLIIEDFPCTPGDTDSYWTYICLYGGKK